MKLVHYQLEPWRIYVVIENEDANAQNNAKFLADLDEFIRRYKAE